MSKIKIFLSLGKKHVWYIMYESDKKPKKVLLMRIDLSPRRRVSKKITYYNGTDVL